MNDVYTSGRYKGLPEVPDGIELEKPRVKSYDGPLGGTIVLDFTDPTGASRAYWARWLESRRAYEQFGDFVDARP